MSWLRFIQNTNISSKRSQLGEDIIIDLIFENIGTTNKFFVDIGAGFYGRNDMSNTNQLRDKGWKGIQVDADKSGNPNIHQLYVTPDNILPFLQDIEIPHEFDLFSIDIDSFDLDVMEAIVPFYKPRVICTEYNGTLDPSKSIKLKYEPGYMWDETNKYGYSFAAGQKFAARHGYKIILNQKNQNLFMVRGDIIKDAPKVTAKRATYHPVNKSAEWENY